MSNHNTWQEYTLSQKDRAKLKMQKPFLLWFTGLSGSGKSTLANAVELALFEQGKHTYLLDGDNIRMGLNQGLGFSKNDRQENLRRIAEVSKLFLDSGLIVLAAFISPFEADRQKVKNIVGKEAFIEIFVDSPLESCEKRDIKGLYAKARRGEISHFTGISSPYEQPKPLIYILKRSIKALKKAEIRY